MEEIKDLDVYNRGLRKGLVDKIWFLDHANFYTLVDYGCADGALMALVHDINPSIGLCGVENNLDMVKLASENVPSSVIYPTLGICVGETLVNLSSVIHEIYAYSADAEAEIDNIFDSGAKFIAIRDMFWSDRYNGATRAEDLYAVLSKESKEKVEDFEAHQGSLLSQRNFTQYLLTYRYLENWNREVRENYFPLSLEEFIKRIPKTYKITYLEHYTLPFLKQKVKEDFGIELNVPTHAKIMLEKV